jgi:hypothetical protein
MVDKLTTNGMGLSRELVEGKTAFFYSLPPLAKGDFVWTFLNPL